jgi:hypothetical protein
MSFSIWSPALDCKIIIPDAKTKNQAKAAFRRYLKEIRVPPEDMKRYMAGIKVEVYVEASHHIIINIGE